MVGTVVVAVLDRDGIVKHSHAFEMREQAKATGALAQEPLVVVVVSLVVVVVLDEVDEVVGVDF